MKQEATSALNVLGTIGMLSIFSAILAGFFTLVGDDAVVIFAAVFATPLWLLGVVFTAAWLLGKAVVGQLAPDDDPTPTD